MAYNKKGKKSLARSSALTQAYGYATRGGIEEVGEKSKNLT